MLLALIGPEWLTITNKNGHRRLDDPEDYVRLEIETALTRKIRVIPILVDEAKMPGADELPPTLAPLVRRNAVEINPHHVRHQAVDSHCAQDAGAGVGAPAAAGPAGGTAPAGQAKGSSPAPGRAAQARREAERTGPSGSRGAGPAGGLRNRPGERPRNKPSGG